MMNHRKTLTHVVSMTTPRGRIIRDHLIAGLDLLTSPADEVCLVLVRDVAQLDGIAVLVKRQASVPAGAPWILDFDPQTGMYLYDALFKTESAAEIIESVKRLLEASPLPQ